MRAPHLRKRTAGFPECSLKSVSVAEGHTAGGARARPAGRRRSAESRLSAQDGQGAMPGGRVSQTDLWSRPRPQPDWGGRWMNE